MESWTAYVDSITTAIFFVGMWLMARRRLKTGFIGLLVILFRFHYIFIKG